MLRYELAPNRQLIDQICQLAIAEDEAALKQMADSGLPLNVELNEESAVARLAQNVATLPAARFLVEKFGGDKAWLVYGLVLLDQVNEARNLIVAETNQQTREEMNFKFIYALGVKCQLPLALQHINQAQPAQRDTSKYWFISGLGRAGDINLAVPMIEANLDIRDNLYKALIAGLGRSNLSDLALEVISDAPSHLSQDLRKILVCHLGLSNSRSAKKIIETPLHRRLIENLKVEKELRREYVNGLSQAWHIEEALAEIATAPFYDRAYLVRKLISDLRAHRYLKLDLELNLKHITAITDLELKRLVAKEFLLLYKDHPELTLDKLLSRSERIIKCSDRFSLNYRYAKILADHWTETINLFLRMIVSFKRYKLPPELFAKITSFVLGASDQDTLVIINAVFDKLHANFSTGVNQQLSLKYKEGLFSQKQYFEKCDYENAGYERRTL